MKMRRGEWTLFAAGLFCVTALVLAPLLYAATPGAVTIHDGSVTVAAAGTAQQLSATSTAAIWIDVQCAVDNTGNCFLGGSTIADGSGMELEPGQSYGFRYVPRGESYDSSLIWVDAATSGDILTFIYAQRGP